MLNLLPPNGKLGWPWTEACSSLPSRTQDGKNWPRISIVTPSFNQGRYLEETIRSVLLQGYPNLEYMVLDGGSTDNSKDIIQAYSGQLAYWKSEQDGGQSDAISQGLDRASGEILGWVNSDDLLLPGCLKKVGIYFATHPNVDCVVGGAVVIDQFGAIMRNPIKLPKIVRGEPETFMSLLSRRGCSFYQPASFWRREAYLAVDGLNTELRFSMDYDLYLRLAHKKPFGHMDQLLACFRVHLGSKTTLLQAVRQQECRALWARYGSEYSVQARAVKYLYLLANILRNLPIRISFMIGRAKLPRAG